MNDNQFPMELAEVLKLFLLICSAPLAFNGGQTSVLVDAPGKSSRKLQGPHPAPCTSCMVSKASFPPSKAFLFSELTEDVWNTECPAKGAVF